MDKIKTTRAICWINEWELLVYKRFRFAKYDIRTKKLSVFCDMPMSKRKRLLSSFKLFRRMLRLYPQSPCYNKITKKVYFSFDGYVYSLDVVRAMVTNEVKLMHGASRVLSFCACENGDTLFGEYPTHCDYKPVCIYKKETDAWRVVFSFPPESIRHIHLLIEKNNDIYCFTGDEDCEVKIIKFTNMDFGRYTTIKEGSQKYRSCAAYKSENGNLLYLTDNPYFENKLCCLRAEQNSYEELSPIDGTVIYSLTEDDSFAFSTVVEQNLKKDSHNQNVPIRIDGKNGGIKRKDACVYCYDAKEGLNLIYTLKKDALPFRLFGLGTFVFPANSNRDFLAFSSSSLTKDETTFVINKHEKR